MENAALKKHKYYKGEVFAMPGAKLPHISISGNFFVVLANKLKGKNCKPSNNDMRLCIPSDTLFSYPDISIVCGEVITLNNDDYNV